MSARILASADRENNPATYDQAGNVRNILSKDGSSATISNLTYTYDNAGRLETADGTTTVIYDATGNRTTVVNGSGTFVYDTGDANQLDSDGVWEYFYDDEGNMTEKNLIGSDEKWEYAYDEKNRLVFADHYDDTLTLDLATYYHYDVYGNRTLKAVDDDGIGENFAVITRFAYDGWNPGKPSPIGSENFDIWLVSDGEGDPIYREVQGEGFDEHLARIQSSNAYFYLADHLNSIRTVLDDTASPINEIEYDAFGNATESNPGDPGWYLYTGREFDVETQLQYNRARYYDATTGRWISQDPLGFDAGDTNLFRYVHNGFIQYGDPSGLELVTYSLGTAKEVQKWLANDRSNYWNAEGPGIDTVIRQVDDNRFLVVPTSKAQVTAANGNARWTNDSWTKNICTGLP